MWETPVWAFSIGLSIQTCSLTPTVCPAKPLYICPLLPAMSSLRNSLHRRSHKERSQLSHRTRLGILEKHKDYVLRARDYHSKQDRINRLREKAATRNKDEFYFSMTRQRTEVRLNYPLSHALHLTPLSRIQ